MGRYSRIAMAASAAALLLAGRAGAAGESPLYKFKGGSDGADPTAGLVEDPSGNGVLYGTATRGGNFSVNGYGGGVVFKLTPPPAGRTLWTETVLYRFVGTTDGIFPTSGRLLIDGKGALYGTTFGVEGFQCMTATRTYSCDTVYRLSPPASAGGKWTHSVLHYFAGGADGQDPEGALLMDKAGSLYGTTMGGGNSGCQSSLSNTQGLVGCGTVYRLAPPAKAGGSWTRSSLHVFSGGADGGDPAAGLLPDPKGTGAFYGTGATGGGSKCPFGPANCGVAFKLSPPAGGKGSWSEAVLHDFTGGNDGALPMSVLAAGKNGVLYGTAMNGGASCDIYGCGTVFALTPGAGGSWSFKSLHVFQAGSDGGVPYAGVAVSAAGVLYGTTMARGTSPFCDDMVGCGVVFALKPGAGGAWSETILHRFSGGGDGGTAQGGVVLDAKGNLYGTTLVGGDPACGGPNLSSGCGVAFKLRP